MPRHTHDDFSFLPTVDSVDKEDVMQDERPVVKAPPVHVEPEPPAHQHEAESPADEEQWEAPPQMEEPRVAAAPRLSVKAPPPANKVRVFEPDVHDHDQAAASTAESKQDGRAMWEAFQAQQQMDAPTIVTPKARPAPVAEPEIEPVMPKRAEPRQTPAVSLGGRAAEKKFTPAPAMPLEPAPVKAAQHLPEDLPKEETPALTDVAEDPEAAPADNTRAMKEAKKRALLMTLGVHVVVALILLLMHVPMLDFNRPEIVATSAVEELENESWKKVTTAAPQTSPMAASVSPLLSTGISDIAMPAVDFSATASDLNLGTSFGSFGTGVTSGGAGGKISFLGNTATAKHVVFVVDVSGSMSASMNVGGSSMSRFDLLKRELNKSISALAAGTAYQVLLFSDFAWPHDTVDSNDMRALSGYEWKITATSKNVSIPRFSYLAANPSNVNKSKKIILDANNPGGTNWGSGLLMALKGSPRPEVIFFMTDGNRSDEQGWINAVSEENSRGKRTIIHTTALGTPDAAKDLAEMARRNGGKFTVVMADGKIVKGEDFLK